MVDIYGNVYDLIVQYLFGGVVDTPNTELITIFLSSCATIFVFSLPFLLVWKVIKMLGA